jgi:hypothetical protein
MEKDFPNVPAASMPRGPDVPAFRVASWTDFASKVFFGLTVSGRFEEL